MAQTAFHHTGEQQQTEFWQQAMGRVLTFLRGSILLLLGTVAMAALLIITMGVAQQPYPSGVVIIFGASALLIRLSDNVIWYKVSGEDPDPEKQELSICTRRLSLRALLILLHVLFAGVGTTGCIRLTLHLYEDDTVSSPLSILLSICNILLFIYCCRIIRLAIAGKIWNC